MAAPKSAATAMRKYTSLCERGHRTALLMADGAKTAGIDDSQLGQL